MKKNPYLPTTDAGKAAWLTNLAAQASAYATPLSLTPANLSQLLDDANFFAYILMMQGQVLAFAQQYTSYKNAARNGDGSPLGDLPVAPLPGLPPTPVPSGIFVRTSALVTRMKTAPGYTDAIGQALQIIGADQTVDLNAMKPVISAEPVAGQIVIHWTKSGMDGVEIWADRGAGFAFLALDSVPDYTDTQAMPAAGQSALWKYKAIYRLGDERVGQWSDIISLRVAG